MVNGAHHREAADRALLALSGLQAVLHVRRVVREFLENYNRARPSQATHSIPAPYPELVGKPLASGELIALPVLGGVQHDYRLAA